MERIKSRTLDAKSALEILLRSSELKLLLLIAFSSMFFYLQGPGGILIAITSLIILGCFFFIGLKKFILLKNSEYTFLDDHIEVLNSNRKKEIIHYKDIIIAEAKAYGLRIEYIERGMGARARILLNGQKDLILKQIKFHQPLILLDTPNAAFMRKDSSYFRKLCLVFIASIMFLCVCSFLFCNPSIQDKESNKIFFYTLPFMMFSMFANLASLTLLLRFRFNLEWVRR